MLSNSQDLQKKPSSLIRQLQSTNIIIWDKNGTITSSVNPNDISNVILPNVKEAMNRKQGINIICSGCRTPESESQNFDPKKIIDKMKVLMKEFPICAAVFSAAIGGVECYVILKNGVI